MSNLLYENDVDTLWKSKEVVSCFKKQITKLRIEHYQGSTGKRRLGHLLAEYFQAVDVENKALSDYSSDNDASSQQFQQAVFDGIKPLLKSKSDENPKGKGEGAAFLAFLSDRHPEIAKTILKFAEKETKRVGNPESVIVFRAFTQEAQAELPESVQAIETGAKTPSVSSHEDDQSNIPNYSLYSLGKWKAEDVSDAVFQRFGIERQYSDVWSSFATCEEGRKDYKNFEDAEFTFQDRAKSKWLALDIPHQAGKNSRFVDGDGSVVAELRNYRHGYRMGSFFLDQSCIFATLFREYSLRDGSNGDVITLHGGGETLSWTLKRKTAWVHSAGYWVPSRGVNPIAFRGANDDRRIIYIDWGNLVVLDGISLCVEGKESGLKFHVKLEDSPQFFWNACFSQNQTHAAISGYSDVQVDSYSGERTYETCVRLFNLTTGEIDFSFPVSYWASECGFQFSAFMNEEKVIAYSDENEIIFYDFGLDAIVGKPSIPSKDFPSQPSETHPSMQFSKSNRLLIVRGRKYVIPYIVVDAVRGEVPLTDLVSEAVQGFQPEQSLEDRLQIAFDIVDQFEPNADSGN